MKRNYFSFLLAALLHYLVPGIALGQTMDLNSYDVFIGDTLISKQDFMANVAKLDSSRAKKLIFKPMVDGLKQIYYLNGAVYAKGEIKNKHENGLWTYWHQNGQKAREGVFVNGKREGIHKYWYPNGNTRGVGNFKNDKYDGKWLMYNEDGALMAEQLYKSGELIK